MSNTLIISYTPRFESNTNKLVQTFVKAIEGKTSITHRDIGKDPAPLLLEENLNVLLKRNYMGMELTDKESECVAEIDELLQELLDADRIVIAFPMYNFSLPAAVKAWLDSVIQNGKTFNYNSDGTYTGLCTGKKALIIMTAGSDFSQEPVSSLNHAVPLIQTCFNFIGIESDAVCAYGLNQQSADIDGILAKAQQQILEKIESDQI